MNFCPKYAVMRQRHQQRLSEAGGKEQGTLKDGVPQWEGGGREVLRSAGRQHFTHHRGDADSCLEVLVTLSRCVFFDKQRERNIYLYLGKAGGLRAAANSHTGL